VNHPSRSGVVAFQPRARLLKLIGSELISDDVLAVTELVKNAHDADASSVTVYFRSVGAPEGEIIISDDGTGMDLQTLLGQWMQPAANSKARPGSRFTPAGRRVLGEKGVGRFAADKLGGRLELISKRKDMPDEVVASFNWDEFDNDTRLMTEITNHWELRSASVQQAHGTTLRITRPRTVWTERMFAGSRRDSLASDHRSVPLTTLLFESSQTSFPSTQASCGMTSLSALPTGSMRRLMERTLSRSMSTAASRSSISGTEQAT
jgi:hypothetical protein